MTLRSESIRGVKWIAVQNYGAKFISFAVLAVLARLLEPAAFGIVALASVYVTFLQVFQDQGFSDAIVQREALEDDHVHSAFWFSTGCGLVLFALSVPMAGVVAHIVARPALAPVIRWLSIDFVLTAVSGPAVALLTRALEFRALATRTVISNVAGGLVGVAMAFAGAGVWALVGQVLVQGIVEIVIVYAAVAWRPRLRFSARHQKDLYRFGVNMLVVNVMTFASRQGDDLLVGVVLGPVALGYYTLAYRLLLVATDFFIATMSAVAFPVFSRLQDEPVRLRQALLEATRLSSTVAVPAFVMMSLTASSLISVAFGPNWGPSVPVLQVLAFIGIVHSVFYFGQNAIKARGKPGWLVVIATSNTIVNLAGFMIAVHWGIVAVAAAYVIRGYLLAPVPLLILRRVLDMRLKVYLRLLVVPAAACAVMAMSVGAVAALIGSDVDVRVRLATELAAGAGTYALFLQLLRPGTLREMVAMATSGFRGRLA
jgi:PST family polysaccharide transporter